MTGTIIITECEYPDGKCWEFKEKRNGQVLAEVDKKKKKDFGSGPLYFVYTCMVGFRYNLARHSKKDSAIEFAKQSLREQFAGVDIKFEMNVMTVKYKWS